MSFQACSTLFVGTIMAAACTAGCGSPRTWSDAASPDIDFTEGYETGTMDVGNWLLTTNSLRPRILESTGGDPGGYLYGEVSNPAPSWSTASTRFQPGVNDDSKRDSVFVGDYYANGVDHVSADLQVYQAGSWTPGRAVTLHLMSWNVATNSLAFEAFYSYPDIPAVPMGWGHYNFDVNARSTRVPSGWDFLRGDGTPGTDADWVTFMHQIDVVEFGYWKPGYAYPTLGVWELGIDNIHVGV